jgi:hypothetical protein
MVLIGGVVVVILLAIGGLRLLPQSSVAGSGKINFGTGIDTSTLAVTGPTAVFAPGEKVGWVATLSEAANATTLTFVLAKKMPGGAEQTLYSWPTPVSNPSFSILANTSDFSTIAKEPGDYLIRFLRDTKVLAEGTFTISAAASAPASVAESPNIPGSPATVKGSESSNSEPFRLSGDYDVVANATSSQCGFFWGGVLKSPTDTSVYTSIPDGTTRLYGLPDREYYFAAEASRCSWTVTFTPR